MLKSKANNATENRPKGKRIGEFTYEELEQMILHPTEEQRRESDRVIAEYDKVCERRNRRKKIKYTIGFMLRRIFFSPLAIMFHLITIVSRFVGGVASLALIYGLYCAYKAFTEWRAGEVFADNVHTAVTLIIFPFIAYGISVVANMAWAFFEDNKR